MLPRAVRAACWGAADAGQLGMRVAAPMVLPFTLASSPSPLKLELPAGYAPVKAAAGGAHSLVLGKAEGSRSRLFVAGLNTSGQLGLGHRKQVEVFEPIPFFDDHTVKHISCGRAHTIVATDKGVFATGHNHFGQCGVGHASGDLLCFEQVCAPDATKGHAGLEALVCGLDHSLFIYNGSIFACGWGADGQTGQGHTNDTPAPSRVVGDANKNITKVHTRADTCVAINEKAELFAFGNSEYSQTGLGTNPDQVMNMTKVLGLPPVVDAAAGSGCSLILTADSSLYSVGYGVLSLQGHLETMQFAKVEHSIPGRPSRVFAGIESFAVLTESGKVYTFGRGSRGRLGLGDYMSVPQPARVSLPFKVTDLACGAEHMIALGTE